MKPRYALQRQGQTGGADSGDGVTNCYNLQAVAESIATRTSAQRGVA